MTHTYNNKMHLHGHDFALLAQGTNLSNLTTTTTTTTTTTGNVDLKFDNPPRRDVVLLPTGGLRGDRLQGRQIPGRGSSTATSPGTRRAGLALQILERQDDLRAMLTTDDRLAETRRVCREWDAWVADPENHFDPEGPFQDDSGI